MAIEIQKDVEQIVYFSTKSGNTHRFVEKLGLPAVRVPIHADSEMPEINTPYILITPTYGGGHAKGAVPKQVIRFLNDSARRHLMRGVIGTGNTNFGEAFAVAGDIVSQKCQVPLLYRLELFGTDDDVHNVKTGVQSLWKQSR